MTTINAASGVTGLGAGAANTGAAAGTDAADRFLTLLVTQLRNQDPLNPLDNAQVTTQLAQINTVSGINKLNDTVAALAASIAAGQSLQAVNLVGHSTLVPGSKLELAAGKGGGGFTLPSAAEAVTVTIKDATGAVVRTLKLGAQPAGTGTFAWDGKSDAAAAAKDGLYTFAVDATAGGKAATVETLMLGKVIGLATGTNGMQLNLGQLGRFDLGQVVEIN